MARLFDVSRFSGQVKGNYLLAQVKIRRVSPQSKAWSRIYRACRPSKSSKVTRFPNGPAGRATAPRTLSVLYFPFSETTPRAAR